MSCEFDTFSVFYLEIEEYILTFHGSRQCHLCTAGSRGTTPQAMQLRDMAVRRYHPQCVRLPLDGLTTFHQNRKLLVAVKQPI